MTTDDILYLLKSWVETGAVVSPSQWIDEAFKLVVLMGDERNKLLELQHKVAKMKVAEVSKGQTAATTKIIVEASEEYHDMLRQKGKLDQVIELIRIAKIQSKLSNEEYKAY